MRRHKQCPWSKGPEQGAGCGAAVEAAGSVFPGVSTQLPVGSSGQRRTRPPLCPRGRLQLSLFETRGDSGARVPAPQEPSCLGFLSGNLGKQHLCASGAAPQAAASLTQRSSTTHTLQSIPRCTQVMISLCTSQGSSVLFNKAASQSAPMELTTRSRAYSNHHRAASQSSLNMVIQSSRTSKKSKI